MTTVWLAIAVGSMALVAQDSTFTRLRVPVRVKNFETLGEII